MTGYDADYIGVMDLDGTTHTWSHDSDTLAYYVNADAANQNEIGEQGSGLNYDVSKGQYGYPVNIAYILDNDNKTIKFIVIDVDADLLDGAYVGGNGQQPGGDDQPADDGDVVKVNRINVNASGRMRAVLSIDRAASWAADGSEVTFDWTAYDKDGVYMDEGSETANAADNSVTIDVAGYEPNESGAYIEISNVKADKADVRYFYGNTQLAVGTDIAASSTQALDTTGLNAVSVTFTGWQAGTTNAKVDSEIKGATATGTILTGSDLTVTDASGAAQSIAFSDGSNNSLVANGDGYVDIIFSNLTTDGATDASVEDQLENGTSASVEGDLTMTDALTVGSGKSLTVSGTVDNSNKTLTVDGALVADEIANISNLTGDGTIQVGGGEAIDIDDLADLSNVQTDAVVAITRTSATGAELNVSGTPTAGVPSGDLQDNVLNGVANGDTNGVTVMTFVGLVPTTGTYTVEQSNPAMKIYYGSSIDSSVKTSTYTNGNGGGETGGDFSILVAPNTTATLTVKDSEGTVVATYTVTANGLILS